MSLMGKYILKAEENAFQKATALTQDYKTISKKHFSWFKRCLLSPPRSVKIYDGSLPGMILPCWNWIRAPLWMAAWALLVFHRLERSSPMEPRVTSLAGETFTVLSLSLLCHVNNCRSLSCSICVKRFNFSICSLHFLLILGSNTFCKNHVTEVSLSSGHTLWFSKEWDMLASKGFQGRMCSVKLQIIDYIQ